jgi:hypothetical protein
MLIVRWPSRRGMGQPAISAMQAVLRIILYKGQLFLPYPAHNYSLTSYSLSNTKNLLSCYTHLLLKLLVCSKKTSTPYVLSVI